MFCTTLDSLQSLKLMSGEPTNGTDDVYLPKDASSLILNSWFKFFGGELKILVDSGRQFLPVQVYHFINAKLPSSPLFT